RPPARDLVDRLAIDPAKHAQVAKNIEEADDPHLPGMVKQLHSLGREQVAADPEHFERWVENFELPDHFGGVQIAGCLTGDDGKFHRSGNGYISQARAMPP